jgi:hypothetical protein
MVLITGVNIYFQLIAINYVVRRQDSTLLATTKFTVKEIPSFLKRCNAVLPSMGGIIIMDNLRMLIFSLFDT